MINALTGKVESAQNHMSGNPTYRDLAGPRSDQRPIDTLQALKCASARVRMEHRISRQTRDGDLYESEALDYVGLRCVVFCRATSERWH